MSEEQAKEKNLGGRPSKYTPELAQHICHLIATCHYGLEKICKLNPDLPEASTIRNWVHIIDGFSLDYEAAKAKQAHLLFDGAIEELEELAECKYINPNTGAVEINSGMVAFKKALSDRKAKHAAVLNKKYRIKQDDDNANQGETLAKIRDMVADFNKTNVSDV